MVINLRPIHSIGKFYNRLNAEGKKQAKALAHNACRMPKIKIEQAVIRLESMSKHNNFDYNPTL